MLIIITVTPVGAVQNVQLLPTYEEARDAAVQLGGDAGLLLPESVRVKALAVALDR